MIGCRQPTARRYDLLLSSAVVGCVAVIICPLLACAADAPSAESTTAPVATRDYEIGFRGRYKLGRWTRVQAAMSAVPIATLVAPDAEGVPVRFLAANASATNDAAGREALFSIGRSATRLIATDSSGRQTIELPIGPALAPQTRLCLSLGVKIDLPRQGEVATWEVVELASLDELPLSPAAYDAVDAVVCSAAALRAAVIDESRLAALATWVRGGGRLIWIDHPSPALPAQRPLALQSLLPAGEAATVTLQRLAALEAYSGSNERISAASRGRTAQFAVTKFAAVEGLALATEGDVPLVFARPHGFGEVLFVAVDLTQPPLATWGGRNKLFARLLDPQQRSPVDHAESLTAAQAEVAGADDLAVQLAAAFDQYPGVTILPFWGVTALILTYMALVGPGDWLFVHHVLRRLEMTWLTLPLLVVVSVGGAVMLLQSTRGVSLQVNQFDVIDADTISGTRRGSSWLSFYSRAARRCEVRLTTPTLGASVTSPNSTPLVGWFAPPSNQGRSMTPGDGLFAAADTTAYEILPTAGAVQGAPLAARSARTFLGQWHTSAAKPKLAPSPASPVPFEAQLRATADGGLTGTLSSRLPARLMAAVLLYERSAWEVGELATGQTSAITPDGQRDLQAVLKQTQVVQNQPSRSFLQVARNYDPTSREIPEIVRALLWYDALGGREYTQLANTRLASLDLSRHLALGRAVLFARAKNFKRQLGP